MAIAYEWEGRDGYRDQIVTCDVGVSLEVEPGNEEMTYSLNDILDDVIAHHRWMM